MDTERENRSRKLCTVGLAVTRQPRCHSVAAAQSQSMMDAAESYTPHKERLSLSAKVSRTTCSACHEARMETLTSLKEGHQRESCYAGDYGDTKLAELECPFRNNWKLNHDNLHYHLNPRFEVFQITNNKLL